jgi:hypothetical protein
MTSLTTRPSGDPGPIFIEYDCRGKRARRWFQSGMGREARSFFQAKYRAGKNPKIVKADGGLFAPAFAASERPAVELRDCQVECRPGVAFVTLAGGVVLKLTADDICRLEFAVRDEPDPAE